MDKRSFWKTHASVLFAPATIAFSLLLILVSIQLENSHPHWATFLTHFAAMCIAASCATVFFSFRDVQQFLAGSISALLIDGDVTRHLSPAQQSKLRRRLLEQSLQTKVEFLPASLVDHIERAASNCLGAPHLINYAATIALVEAQGHPGFVRRSFHCTYVVDCHHLKGGRGVYPLRLRHELSDPSGRLAPEEMLDRLEVRVGTQKLDRNDAKVVRRASGGANVTLVSVDRDIEVGSEAKVSVSLESLADPHDPSQILYAVYPTKGFRATLLYKEGLKYDVAWFKPWDEVPEDFPGREEVETMAGGITAYTHEWVLPGEGVVLYWFSG